MYCTLFYERELNFAELNFRGFTKNPRNPRNLNPAKSSKDCPSAKIREKKFPRNVSKIIHPRMFSFLALNVEDPSLTPSNLQVKVTAEMITNEVTNIDRNSF